MQRRALTALFGLLAAALGAVSAFALAGGDSGRRLLVGAAAAAVAVWLATLAVAAARHRR